MGYAPNATFDPISYTEMNDDVERYAHGALIHYIRHGKAERRFTQSPLDACEYFEGEFPAVPEWPKSARLAVVVHVYYKDVWEQIARHLSGLDVGVDVIVTIPDLPDFDDIAECVVKGPLSVAHVQRQPNVGRDVLGFLNLVNSGHLSRYEAVCKLHTKKSPHLVDGDIWQQELTEGLLPQATTGALVEAFLSDDSAQMLVPSQFLYEGDKWWSINKPVAEHLLENVGLYFDMETLEFAAGSMFWVKPKLLEEIRSIGFRPEQFVLESGQLDGTTAHAFERLTGWMCKRVGGRIAKTSELVGIDDTQLPKKASEFKMITGSNRSV